METLPGEEAKKRKMRPPTSTLGSLLAAALLLALATAPPNAMGAATSLASTTANATTTSNVTTSNIIGQQKQWAPKSDREQVLNAFKRFFTRPRSHEEQAQKELVRTGLVARLQQLGFAHTFLQRSRFEFRRQSANSYNVISIIPGPNYQTANDSILLLGAHWDSATQAPGVDDNGSGCVCLLEIARLISSEQHRCQFNQTLMLVWFDYEEQGKFGSEFFVNDYLYPHHLDKWGSRFTGAYILDMILVRDKEPQSQLLPFSMRQRLSELNDELEREKWRADFLAAWSRRHHDEPLEAAFRRAWLQLGNEGRTFKALRPELPQDRLPNAEERYLWKDFFRSDHASFWFPQMTSTAVRRAAPNNRSHQHLTTNSLNAVLLTDMGPWRRSYQRCYHAACDDEHLLTDDNLSFMQQTIDALLLTLVQLATGQCQQQFTQKSSNTTSKL